MFSPPVIVIYDYFDKYKSFASGIGMTGHSVAVITILPLLRFLIDEFGWQGTVKYALNSMIILSYNMQY